MKQVVITFKAGGKCTIDAHGTFGEGTADFTLELAQELGEITERHEGFHHAHAEEAPPMEKNHGS